MPDRHSNLQTQPELLDSLPELLRSRAVSSSPRLLVGQAIAGVTLNAAVLAWHPDRWGIASAAMVTIALNALWSVSVQRTGDTAAPIGSAHYSINLNAPGIARRGWWLVRRASAFAASASALLVLWFVCMMLLGRMIS